MLKTTLLSSAVALALLASPVWAQSGCCSHHGGVAGCNTATGYELCKDHTTSPTCKCKNSTMSTSTTTSSTITKPKKHTTTSTTATTTTSATTTTTAKPPKGCCAKHGGVAKCDKTTGYQICKDGTHSPTCKC